jgi:thioredoxin reductase (NADPH)
MRQQAERFGARFMAGLVAAADFSGRPLQVRLDSGETLSARTVIVATGASARYLGLESEQKRLGAGSPVVPLAMALFIGMCRWPSWAVATRRWRRRCS